MKRRLSVFVYVVLCRSIEKRAAVVVVAAAGGHDRPTNHVSK
jgi:hypothetical protein